MNKIFTTASLILCCVCVPAFGQKADLAPLVKRSEVLAKATALIESRGRPVVIPEQLVNPFVGREEVAKPSDSSQAPVVIADVLKDADLLAKLAAQIPVSGTAVLGGDSLLLLGQKRLKAGDIVRISFEGKSYELTIDYVGTTTFTVSKGGLTHTRPTRLSR